MENISPNDLKLITADEFCKKLCIEVEPYDFEVIIPGLLEIGLDKIDPRKHFKSYINLISKFAYSNEDDFESKHLLTFSLISERVLVDHPALPPDYHRQSHIFAHWHPETEGDDVHWAEVEASGAIYSREPPSREGLMESAFHSAVLLQARPDRVYIQGFYAHCEGINLILSGDDGFFVSPVLKMQTDEDIIFLYSFVRRLYKPAPYMKDSTMTRRKNLDTGLYAFDILLSFDDGDRIMCYGYRIKDVTRGRGAGKRVHMLVNEEDPTEFTEGHDVAAIKEMYCDPGQFHGRDLKIDYIHNNGFIPGIFQLAHSAAVLDHEGNEVRCGERRKIRMELTHYGRPFLDIRTPKEVLICLYDLLETTRVMYCTRSFLHRDICPENALFDTLARLGYEPGTDDMDDNGRLPPFYSPKVAFFSARYLLSEFTNPSMTSNVLVNVEMGDVIEPTTSPELDKQPTGNPAYMARAVRKGHPLGTIGDMLIASCTPDLLPGIYDKYVAAYPERMTRFQCGQERHAMRIVADPNNISTHHDLRHDAESIFWLLVRWTINAAPEGRQVTGIDPTAWALLTSQRFDQDFRAAIISSESVIDPSYAPLSALIRNLWETLEPELYWATNTPYTDPEFVHESLQRHILNYLVENGEQEFMNHPTSDMHNLSTNRIRQVDVKTFWQNLYRNPSDFGKIAPVLEKLEIGNLDVENNFAQYLNKISRVIASHAGLPQERVLTFSDTSNRDIRDHPIRTDYMGPCHHVFAFPHKVMNLSLQWGDIEASAGIHLGPSTKESLQEVVDYTATLLAARPDRVYMQALYAHSGGVQLILSSAGGIIMTNPLNVATSPGVELLYAFVQRLYNPHPSYLDPTIRRRRDPQTGSNIFDIILLQEDNKSVACMGYRLAYSGTRTDKRTHVFVNRENPAMLECDVYAPVIKEVYADEKYKEDDILLQVHTGRGVPGVVDYAH
ncbi:hypothetical protein HYPSUDRAFT_209406 [Hypholoma sublateritium FD-334 SS-4]|uniref:Fungal-type protein kinase domain-containing protein n=1 Tax=Hypholoma sublateritium (strain FD-334 SS-4) TaxID=945553 RepID=A0A0D2KGC5_HYPSF|nr:hypothetical protein HYPSUDRAFT_209406 [Hypholoma sublateritium FD-334 SS-4]